MCSETQNKQTDKSQLLAQNSLPYIVNIQTYEINLSLIAHHLMGANFHSQCFQDDL